MKDIHTVKLQILCCKNLSHLFFNAISDKCHITMQTLCDKIYGTLKETIMQKMLLPTFSTFHTAVGTQKFLYTVLI